MLQERIVHSMCKQLLKELTRKYTVTQLIIGSLAMDTRARTAAAAAAATAAAAAATATSASDHSPGADVHTDSHSAAGSTATTAAAGEVARSRWGALRKRDSILDMFSSTGSEDLFNTDTTAATGATAAAGAAANSSAHFGSSSGHHRWPQLRKRTSEDSNAPSSPLSSPSHHNGTADTSGHWGSKRSHDSSSTAVGTTTGATAASASACAVDQLRTILDIVKRTVLVAVLQQGCVAAAAASADAASSNSSSSSSEQLHCRERAEQELRSVDEGGDAAVMSALLEQVRRAGELADAYAKPLSRLITI
jgi:trimeric autotransporter adhesin